jgi:hypothetical protein
VLVHVRLLNFDFALDLKPNGVACIHQCGVYTRSMQHFHNVYDGAGNDPPSGEIDLHFDIECFLSHLSGIGSVGIFANLDPIVGSIRNRGAHPFDRNLDAWHHRGFYRQRHKIENFFQRIKIYKRVSTRYDKLALTFINFILLAAVLDWLKLF